MSKSKIFLILVVFAGLSLLAGCSGGVNNPEQGNAGVGDLGNGDFPRTVVDTMERSVDIEREPQRIVTLAPGNTEIVFALGIGDRLVGVTNYCNYPKEALDKEKVGGYSDPNIEKIISLNPDLILATREHREMIPEFENAGIPVVILQATTVDGVIKIVALAGEATGRTEAAENIVADMEGKIERVESKIKDIARDEKPMVYYEVFHEPIMTAGPGTPIHDIIDRAGGINIAADADNTYPQYSMEVLVKKNPEVIIAARHSMELQKASETMTAEEMRRHDKQVITSIKERPGWSAISAINNDRVYLIEDDLLTGDGPRVADGLVELATALYPDRFTD